MEKKKRERFAGKRELILLEEWLNLLAARERAAGHMHTASNYESALSSVQKYLGADAGGFLLSEVVPDWVERYAVYLKMQQGLKAGSANCYFRNLRAIYNKAVKEGILPPSAIPPFRGVSIPVPPTAKRTLSAEDMRKITEARLPEGTPPRTKNNLARARDIFLFLFHARGMCFVDVFNLKKENVHGDYIGYSRSKTGVALQVKITPELKLLMERYEDADSPYLFPFLREKLRGSGSGICCKSALRRTNRYLGKLGGMLGISNLVTTYSARHTWASLLESCGVNTSVISQGLGHSSERVTRIYMKGMPSHVLDGANEQMLDCFLRGQKKKEKEINKKCPLLCKKGTFHIFKSAFLL
ncbi:MAG: hypothetical protein PARBA_01820 [Parabacteroides sp.]